MGKKNTTKKTMFLFFFDILHLAKKEFNEGNTFPN